ncbi:SusC/RagA family TonB-linked outer membrane protein [Flavobacterium eburneipallidum]|uniref:SusC/RagA family TonB-linked outer membrane protein n=1 Tax=Flavobacterium eburneipallidum TaxID=3003263 RepID=UPI00248249F7|nr:TonB-dependent receptor [Flavobacterium eburneipallidum]
MKVSLCSFLLGILLCMPIYGQEVLNVSGTVTDDAGPLPGVSVLVKGTNKATSADLDGKYVISAKSNDVLVFSFVGYKSVEKPISGKSNINVSMAAESSQLNEVVVVGYGSVKKTDLTGSVSTIKPEAITERNVNSPLEAIQGSMPGVQITSNSGRSGDGYKMVIRGNNSLGGSSPLYIVDGVPTDNIDFLNPQDIARMDILKDASSAAIYGSRGSNGVVIVTTKSGTSAKGGISISFESSYGTKTASRLPEMMTASEWWKFHRTAYMTANPVTQTQAQLLTASSVRSALLVERANNGYSFDWYDAVLQSGMTSNNYLNLSGRAENGLSYNLAFGIQKDEGLIDKDTNDKYNFKLGVNHKINNKFSTGANLTIARVVTELGSDLAMQEAFRLSPLLSPWAVDSNGQDIVGQLFFLPGKLTLPNSTAFVIDKTSTVNPLVEIANSVQDRNRWQTIGNVYFQYQPIDWLSFKTTFAAGFENEEIGKAFGAESNAGVGLNGKRSASLNKNENFNYTWDNQIDIKKTFNEVHDFSALLLQSLFSNVDKTSFASSNGMPFDTGYYDLGAGVQTSYNMDSFFEKRTLSSYALRLNYVFKDKYLLTATNRWDGASVLAEGVKWQSFPSVALGWKISKESFLQNNKVISDLKLRASLGYTGNNNVQPYSTQQLLDQQTFYANGTNLVTGWESKNLANAGLTWEKTRELNFGLDFGFLANRISGSVDVYDRLSDELIFNRALPYEYGVPGGATISNVGSISNKGVEVILTTKNIQTDKVKWETTFTFTKNVNSLESINGQNKVDDIGNNLFIGKPLNSNYNYVYDGVWQESEAAQAATYNMLPGQARPKDLNSDGKFDALDRTTIGNPNPQWQGSAYSKLTIGNFDFNFSILTSQGQTVLSSFHQNFANVSDRGRQKMKMDYFIPTNGGGIAANASNAYPRPGPVATGAGAFWGNNFAYYRDASYVKIKNISFGYTLPSELIKKLKVSNLRVYVNILDPFVFTDFEGYDPEWASASLGVNRPASITTQLGLSLKF